MDAWRLSRALLAGAAVAAVAACAQQPKLATVSHSTRIAYTPADRECMARAMYFESNKSSSDGMLAVGTVVANRVQSGRYGPSVCGVVSAKRQFAPGVMTRSMTGPSADLARQTADQVLAGGKRHSNVKQAMHFHTAGLRFRYPNMHYVLVAGGNAFYEKRSSEGGGRAANSRSLALALANARANPTVPTPIQVAAATPIEGGASPTELSAGVRDGAQAEQPIRVATLVQPREPQPVASQADQVRPALAASTHPFARARAASTPPTAYAQIDDRPVVAFPKITPAPRRMVQPAEPALASAAPEAASPAGKAERRSETRTARAAPAKRVISPANVEPALASAAPAAAPAAAPERVAEAAPVRNPVADAFSAFQ